MSRKRAQTEVIAGRLVLDGSVTIRTIDSIHERLSELLQTHERVEVDCSAVEDADLQLVQLLLSARKSAQAMRKTLALSAPVSDKLRSVLLRSGVLAAGEAGSGVDMEFWGKEGLSA